VQGRRRPGGGGSSALCDQLEAGGARLHQPVHRGALALPRRDALGRVAAASHRRGRAVPAAGRTAQRACVHDRHTHTQRQRAAAAAAGRWLLLAAAGCCWLAAGCCWLAAGCCWLLLAACPPLRPALSHDTHRVLSLCVRVRARVFRSGLGAGCGVGACGAWPQGRSRRPALADGGALRGGWCRPPPPLPSPVAVVVAALIILQVVVVVVAAAMGSMMKVVAAAPL
jgi:hypothetical protein